MSIKKNLLQIVQDILEALDSDQVNSIGDSNEAAQIASLVESCYYDIVAQRNVPEHKSFFKLTSASSTSSPTHFTYPTNTNSVQQVWYDVSDDGTFEYREVCFIEPLEFVERVDKVNSNFVNVGDRAAGTNLRIRTDKHPEFYTSFDDENIVMDSYNSSVDTVLQESKTRAYGITYPVFNRNLDTFVPDIDAEFFPYLIAEAKSMAFDIYKGGSPAKVEQSARRNKSYIQNNKYRTERANIRNDYGRH